MIFLFLFVAVSAIDVLNIAIPSDHINGIDTHAFIYNEDIFGVGTPGFPGKSPGQFKRTLENGGFAFTLEAGSDKYTRLERGPLRPSRQLEEFIQEQKKLQAQSPVVPAATEDAQNKAQAPEAPSESRDWVE